MSAPRSFESDRTPSSRPLRTVIAIASAGRPTILGQTVRYIAKTLAPAADEILVCTPNLEDAAELPDLPNLRAMVGRRGLCAQRNELLKAATGADLVVFFDDDFFPAPDFIARTVALFQTRSDVAVATGNVLLDGIHGPGVTPEEAKAFIARIPPQPHRIVDTYNAYGCNMVVRMDLVRSHAFTFDENLPLYAWLEDLDFSRRLARHGRSVRCSDMVGVHLGVKTGRSPGRRLGYSQVANPWYLVRKGTMSASKAWSHAGRNFLANVAGTIKGDALVDRKGRLSGNLAAIGDILRARSSPARVLSFQNPPGGASGGATVSPVHPATPSSQIGTSAGDRPASGERGELPALAPTPPRD